MQTSIRNQHKTKRVSRRGRGAGAWCRTCCYWFCGSDGAGNVLDGSIVKSGFWAIIERKIGRRSGVAMRASSRIGSFTNVIEEKFRNNSLS
ncbi:hypothetical protein VC35_16095 [Pseudomonas fluorescens]|uniref:Uncharacterized protein n=1 Tax=Pseudomonas fluorescens TaxID=294 RepID=A0A0F4TJY9_PSEFL|nr:hypothetical protein VC35_16095 [Pseudomonas fluorescens]